jgi:hypothetical protein
MNCLPGRLHPGRYNGILQALCQEWRFNFVVKSVTYIKYITKYLILGQVFTIFVLGCQKLISARHVFRGFGIGRDVNEMVEAKVEWNLPNHGVRCEIFFQQSVTENGSICGLSQVPVEEDLADENNSNQNPDEQKFRVSEGNVCGAGKDFSAHRVSRRTEPARAVCPGRLAHRTI